MAAAESERCGELSAGFGQGFGCGCGGWRRGKCFHPLAAVG